MTALDRVTLFRGSSRARAECEQALLERWANVVPIYLREAWSSFASHERAALLATRDEQGLWRSGVSISTAFVRAVPGAYVMRVHRAGAGIAPADIPVLAAALRKLADSSRMALRLSVEVFSRDAALREALAAELARAGFHRVAEPLAYTRTVVVDMRGHSETTLLASFSERARRHVRAMVKHPIHVAPITDPSMAPRLRALMEESFTRTGGAAPPLPWPAIIESSRRFPWLSRIAGLFHDASEGANALLAFAWGCMHGDHAHYDAAASTRREDLRIPLGYGPVWDLLIWSRSNGATWFDFGGITAGSAGSADPLGGISDFKRGFSPLTEDVQEEWAYDPHPRLLQFAHTIRRAARTLRPRSNRS